jgi:hypothetical protein
MLCAFECMAMRRFVRSRAGEREKPCVDVPP